MAYLEPPALTRYLINPLVSRLQAGGVATLTVIGRRSGRPRTVPVIPVEVEGVRYLVSPYGESQWVRNLRAAGRAQLQRHGVVETIRPAEVAAGDRPAIIAVYRKACGRTVDPCFAKLPDPADHPVFRIEATGPA